MHRGKTRTAGGTDQAHARLVHWKKVAEAPLVNWTWSDSSSPFPSAKDVTFADCLVPALGQCQQALVTAQRTAGVPPTSLAASAIAFRAGRGFRCWSRAAARRHGSMLPDR